MSSLNESSTPSPVSAFNETSPFRSSLVLSQRGIQAPLLTGLSAASSLTTETAIAPTNSVTAPAPTVQVQLAPTDLLSLGMAAQSLPGSAAVLVGVGSLTAAPIEVPTAPPVTPPITLTGELVFIDPSLPDYQSLKQGVRPGVTAIVLKSDRDGIAQITQVLSYAKNVSAVHIVSLGDAGVLKLGASQVTTDSLEVYKTSFQKWATSFVSGADILVYGSNVGTGDLGASFTEKLSQLAKADVAASTNTTGSSALGGDWNLEKTVLQVDTAAITAQTAFQPSVIATYGATFSL